MRIVKALLYAILALILMHPRIAFSQTTGKIAGTVLDQTTDEPLVGANVIIENTTMGAAVDLDGNYFIINVPPGNYSIVFRMIGYNMVRVEDVRVSVNRTTTIDAQLAPAVLEGEEVVVQAEKISVKKDQTSSVRAVSADQIEVLPVEDINAVVEMQTGVVNGHFRGGRNTEVSYLIDGIQVDQSFDGEGRTVDLETDAIQDLEVITGTFNAEYGRAMSGVVNAVTRDGSNQFSGSFAANLANYFTAHDDVFIGLKNSEVTRNQDYTFNLGGPVVKDRLHFFTNFRFQNNLNHLNGIRRFNVDDFSIFADQDSMFWFSEHNGDGKYVSLNRSQNLSFLGKLSLKLFENVKASLLYTLNDDEWNDYDHAFKYNPDGKASIYRKSQMLALQLSHMLSPSAFYEIKLSWLDNYHGYYLHEAPLSSEYVHDVYLRSDDNTGFFTGGQQKDHDERTLKDLNAKFDFTWQLNSVHSLKSGVLYTHHDLDNKTRDIRNEFYGTDLEGVFEIQDGKVVFPNYQPIVYADSSRYSDIYRVKPWEFSGYLQDKMEFDEMVINVGIRYDYFNPNTTYPSNRRNPANKLEYADSLNRFSTYPRASAEMQVSPRLGLAYQLSDRAVLHFSYGHFFQMPPMYALYENHSYWLGSDDYEITMGNTEIKAQKTVQYEIGLWQQLNEMMGIEVSLYYRDIYDLLSTQIITTYNQVEYGLYTNKDYGNSKGLEIKYDFTYGPLTANLNYTLQYTRGNADNPVQNFNRAGNNEDPVNKLIPMSWDQRHTLNSTVGYHRKNYGITLTGYYNSGSPYTWEPVLKETLAGINLFPNNDYRPSRISVDLAAFYELPVYQKYNLKFTLSVYNLLDRLNEESVDAQTGRAYTAIIQPQDEVRHHSDFNTYEDRIENPSMYAAPRLVKIGLGISF